MRILKLDSDLFCILVDGFKPMTGNMLKTVMTLAALDIDFKEIEDGLADLVSNGHDIAYYGVNRTFLYSGRKESA
jgi:hypothetical protein